MTEKPIEKTRDMDADTARVGWLVGKVFGVTWDDVVAYGRTPNLSAARHMVCLFLRERGYSLGQIAKVVKRDKHAVANSVCTAKKRTGSTVTAQSWLAEKLEALDKPEKPVVWCPPVKPHVKKRIVDDMHMGLSAYETLHYWHYPERVSLDVVKQVRTWAEAQAS